MKKERLIIEREVVHPRRFELLTYSFGGCRSIQLSYGCRSSRESDLNQLNTPRRLRR